MKFFIGLIVGIFSLCLGTAQAQGIERMYKQSKGDVVTLTRQGDRDVRADGQIDLLNEWGNRISRSSPASVQYIPHNGQLPEAPFQVGQKWQHAYEVKEGAAAPYKRTRNCEVKQQGAVTVGTFTYDQSWQVVCTNQRQFRDLPMHEVAWYTGDRIIISYTESWGGTSPGSFTSELVAPPQVSSR